MGATQVPTCLYGRTTVGLAIGTRHYREALALHLDTAPDLRVADLGDGPVERLLERLLDAPPDLALVDLPARECAFLVRELRCAAPEVRVIALGQEDDPGAAAALFELGISGYLTRLRSLEEVGSAIRGAIAGEIQCTPRIMAAVIQRLVEVGDRNEHVAARDVSPREARVLGLLEAGLTNKQIAGELGVEESTIKNHVHNILRKLGARNRRDAVRRFRREERLDPI